MDYGKILKRSFDLVWRNRFLWFLGLFAGGSGVNLFNYSGNGSNFKWEDFKSVPTNQAQSMVSNNFSEAGKVLGEKITSNDIWIIVLTVIGFLLLLTLIYLSVSAKGALTLSIATLNDEKKINLRGAWKLGHKFFWRRLSFAILLFALSVIPLIVLVIPVVILAIFNLVIPAVVLGIIFGLAYIVFILYIALVAPYAERILFIQNKKSLAALKLGVLFFNKYWKNITLVYLILLGVGFGVGMALFFSTLICGLLAFGIVALISLVSHLVAIIFGIILALAILIALIILSGGVSAFSWSVITLTYLEKTK